MPVFVLTTARSGSSAVARILADRLGYDMGKIGPLTRANPQGAYECQELVKWNRARLEDAIHAKIWRSLVYTLGAGKSEPWGWKDPQMADLLPETLELFLSAKLIWADRHVDACVQSRMRFASNHIEAEWSEIFMRRHMAIDAVMKSHRGLALDMNRRWTDDALEAALREYLERSELELAREVR